MLMVGNMVKIISQKVLRAKYNLRALIILEKKQFKSGKSGKIWEQDGHSGIVSNREEHRNYFSSERFRTPQILLNIFETPQENSSEW